MLNFKTRIRIFIFFLLFAAPALVGAQQAPNIEWQRCLGGKLGTEKASSIVQTFDGGYIIAAYAESNEGDITGNHGGRDAWIVKLSATNAIEWQHCYGGALDDEAHTIIQTADSGYIFSGYTNSFDGDVKGFHDDGDADDDGPDAWVVKLSATGKIEWQKCFGGFEQDVASNIVQTKDLGYIVQCSAQSIDGDVSGNHGAPDIWILKLNATGNIQWQHCYGGKDFEDIGSIIQTSDGNYIFVGSTGSVDGDVSGLHGEFNYDAWVVKIDSLGKIIWQKCLGGSFFDQGKSIIEITGEGGGYAIAAMATSNNGDITGNHGGDDGWVVKLDPQGNIQWQKCIGGSGDEEIFSIVQTSDNGLAVAGRTNSGNMPGFHGGLQDDAWVVKLDRLGTIEWSKCLGGSNEDWANSIIETSDHGFAVAGYTLSTNGDVAGNHGAIDAWVVKLGPNASVGNSNSVPENLSLSVFPNPTANSITLSYDLPNPSPVTINIYSITGERMQVIQRVQEESGHHETSLDLGGYANGTYFISVSACGMMQRQMVQVVR